jgi:hypothetical protein
VSWYGNSLLPAVMDALHEPGGSGEFRRPSSAAQLATWLREVGCESEAQYVEKMSPAGLQTLLDYFPLEEGT